MRLDTTLSRERGSSTWDPGSLTEATTTPAPRNATAELLHETARRATRYLDGLSERRVAPSPEALASLAPAWDTELPREPSDAREVIRLLDVIGSPATMAMAGPRFFGM